MTQIKKPVKEQLYLERGQREVYVNTSCLAQHQIEGIRFLYHQYRKKKPGIILNNPEGYGKSIQVALFLDSIRESLTNPVLIWCEDDKKINSWKQTIIKWTKYTKEDMVVDSSNVYVKKRIFLTKGTLLEASYSRRDWGVVIVKSDFVVKQLLKTPITAIYKIWLTTIDMRKDLDMFNSIYCWLNSIKKFDINIYIDSISNVADEPLVRAKLLDSFIKDIVFIQNDFTPSKKSELIQETPSKSKVSRKNKDATGTKIKRSKKLKESNTLDDGNNDLDTSNTNIESDADLIKVSNSKRDCKMNKKHFKTTNFVKDAGLDVENFIKDKEPVECEEYEFLNESIELMDTENCSFTNALHDVVENENANDSESIVDVTLSTDQQTANVKNTTYNKNNSEQLSSNATDKEMVWIRTKEKKIDIMKAIAEMEEQAMKKFKNSVLDDFF